MALLPRQILTRLVNECREKGESAYDLIGGLVAQNGISLRGCFCIRIENLPLASFTKEMPETVQKDLLWILALRMDKME